MKRAALFFFVALLAFASLPSVQNQMDAELEAWLSEPVEVEAPDSLVATDSLGNRYNCVGNPDSFGCVGRVGGTLVTVTGSGHCCEPITNKTIAYPALVQTPLRSERLNRRTAKNVRALPLNEGTSGNAASSNTITFPDGETVELTTVGTGNGTRVFTPSHTLTMPSTPTFTITLPASASRTLTLPTTGKCAKIDSEGNLVSAETSCN